MIKLAFSLILCSAFLSVAPASQISVEHWQLIDAQKIQAKGEQISQPAFSTVSWMKATVPGTVLTSLVDDGVYPEPLYGENNRSVPESLCRTSYWYRTEMALPKVGAGRHLWLEFKGINYIADVYVNGKAVGTVRGAFVRGEFDITAAIAGSSRAAIAVHILPPNHPGAPEEQTVAAGTGRNGGALGADSPTFLATVGWDWIPGIRDRDMGIWEPVLLKTTGPAALGDPQVRSNFDDHQPDHAEVATLVDVRNLEQKRFQGFLVGRLEPTGLTFRSPVSLAPGETKSLRGSITVPHPKLWWPNGYGPQNMYRLRLSLISNETVDEEETSIGIRSMRYFRDGSKDLTIMVNGTPIFCKGGNWGMDEAMKRSPRSRLEAQIRMHHDANVDMIRNWVGMSTQEDFYDLCDKYEILVWDDFWLANPYDGPNPVDPEMFLANAREKIVRYRNHPSIAVWCGRNEGDPPKTIDGGLASLIASQDPDRIYQKHSASYNGVGGGGPYSMQDPARYFSFKDAFHTEVGAPSIPTLEAIHEMMPEKDWWPINDDWAEHDLCRGAQRGDQFAADVAKRYGPITDLKSFVRESQIADYETYRAMFEGRNSRLFNPATGVLLWMSNPSQPSFVWQLYSYDLEPNSAEFATQKACEPVHVQFNPVSKMIEIVNNTPKPLTHYRLEWKRFGLDQRPIDGNSLAVDATPSSAVDVVDLSHFANPSGPYFLSLSLSDAGGRGCSTNFYWESEKEDFEALDRLPTANLKISIRGVKKVGNLSRLSFTISNPGETLALLAHVQLRDKGTGKRILPVYYSDNYITLMPGQSMSLSADYSAKSAPPEIHLDGWNVAEQLVSVR